jgi:autotransporter-associated beta strand protein
MGFSLNDGGTQGTSYANRVSGSRLYVQAVGTTASWEVNRSGGSTSLDYNTSSTGKNYVFKVYVTSNSTANVLLTEGATDKRAYNLAMNGSAGANIDAFSLWLKDNWNGASNSDIYWKQTTSVEDLGFVELGYYLASGTFNPGAIPDGLAADSTGTARVNRAIIGGDAGSSVIFDDTNTYTGNTTINTNARLELQSAGAINGTSQVIVSNNATLSIFNGSGGITLATKNATITGIGVSAANGAIRSTGGTNFWPGNVTLSGTSRINADNSGAAGSLSINGTTAVGANTLYIGGNQNITFNGPVTGTLTSGSGALFIDNTATTTLAGTNNVNLTGLVLLRAGTLSAATNANLPAGTLQIGNAATTTTLAITGSSSTHSGNISVENSSSAGVVNVASGQTFTLSGTVQQTAGGNASTKFGKSGAGTLRLNTASTYAGQIQIGEGTLLLANTTAHGTNTSTLNRAIDLGLNVGDVEQGNNVAIYLLNGVSNNASIYVAPNTSGATRTIGLSGSGSASFLNDHFLNGNATLTGDAGTITFSGGFSNTGGLIVTGGTVVLNKANTQTGATVVNGGTLRLDIANALQSTTAITVNSGASLTIAAAGSVNDSAAVTLAGGTLAATGTQAEGIGALTVSSNSVIDMGSGDVDFTFASLASIGGTNEVAIHNYTVGTDTLVFTTNTTAAANLSKFKFYSGAGTGLLGAARFTGSTLEPTPTPIISSSGTPAQINTTYGSNSSVTSFAVSGTNMSAGILVTPPAGFQVSTDNSTFSSTVTVGSSGTIASTTVFLRIPNTTAVGTYSGNIVLSSSGAASANVATTSSSVSQKGLTITGISISDKAYNGLTPATIAGSASYSGLANSESHSVTGTPAASFGNATVGSAKAVTITGYTAPNGNYSISQPSLTGNITTRALTITANSTAKTFNNALTNPTTGSTAFTSSGLQNSETIGTVTLTYAGGYNATDSAGTYNITPSAAAAGTFTASNYNISYVAGTLTVNAIAPTLTTPSKASIATTSATLGATVTSGGGAALSARGTVWGTTAAPTGNSLAEGGTTVSAFTHSRTSLTANTLYYYRGYATNSAGTSYSADDTFTTLPLAPTVGSASSLTATGFTAAWSHPSMGNASYTYTLEVSTNNSTFASPATTSSIASSSTSQAVTGLASGTTYYFRVKAVNTTGDSAYSSGSAAVLTIPAAPAAPTFASVASTSFTVNWSAATGAASYRLDVDDNSDFSSPLAGYNDLTVGGTSQAVTGLSVGTTYYARVRAVNASGTSASSSSGTQATTTPGITINATTAVTSADFTATYGTASAVQTFAIAGTNLVANITATAGTGFEVASDGATYGATATFTNSGGSASGTLSVRLAATAAAATSYLSATAATMSSTSATSRAISTDGTGSDVVPKALTITGASATNRAYNGLAAVTVSGGSLSGVVNSDVVTLEGTPAGTVASAAIGTAKAVTVTGYSISGAGASNYSLTQPTDVTVNITTAALTITANSTSKAFNNALTTPATAQTTFTSSGLQNSETIGSVTLTYAGGYNATDSAGTYNITPSAATGGTFTASNYNISYVAGTLTVTAIAPTVTTGTSGSVTTTGAVITGSDVTSGGGGTISQRGVVYGTSASPALGGGNTTVADGSTTTGSFNSTLTGLTGGITYHVRAFVTTGHSTAYGSSISFTTTADVPAKVTLSTAHSPINGGFTVAWSDVTGETGYHLHYSTNSTFASGVTEVTNIAANATSHNITGLTNNSTYFVRVRGVSGGGNGTWSDSQVNQLNALPANSIRYLSSAGQVGAYTVAGIFGATNQAGLAAATTAGSATTIMLLSEAGSTAHTIFYKSDVNGWREGNDDKASTAIPQGTAFMMKNNSGSTDYFLLAATPRSAPVTVTVNATAGQVNLLTPARSTPTALNALNLTGGNATNSIHTSAGSQAADLVLIPQPDGTFRRYHHDGTKWKSGLRDVADDSAVTVPAGGAFFIRKAPGSSFNSYQPPSE